MEYRDYLKEVLGAPGWLSCPTLDLSLGLDLRVVNLSPTLGMEPT